MAEPELSLLGIITWDLASQNVTSNNRITLRIVFVFFIFDNFPVSRFNLPHFLLLVSYTVKINFPYRNERVVRIKEEFVTYRLR